MKAASFDYVAPKTVAEAVSLLASNGAATAAIAGGQSLLPMLNLRVALPDLLVDIGGLQELKEVAALPSSIRIGALTTHAAIEDGMAPNDAQYLYVYVRNQNPRLRTLPVARDVDMLFLDGCEAPPERDAALTELAKRTTPFSSLYYYDVTVANGTIRHIEQHLTEAAC